MLGTLSNMPQSQPQKSSEMNTAATQGKGQHSAHPICAQHRLSASLHSKMTCMVLCLCLGLLGTGCGPHLTMKADHIAHLPNPMLNANYSENTEIPFMMEPKTAMAEGSMQANFASESAEHGIWQIGLSVRETASTCRSRLSIKSVVPQSIYDLKSTEFIRV
jgi:hypothetical protein